MLYVTDIFIIVCITIANNPIFKNIKVKSNKMKRLSRLIGTNSDKKQKFFAKQT